MEGIPWYISSLKPPKSSFVRDGGDAVQDCRLMIFWLTERA